VNTSGLATTELFIAARHINKKLLIIYYLIAASLAVEDGLVAAG